MAYPRESLEDCSFELCRIQPPVRELMHNGPPAMYPRIRGNVTNEEVEQALRRFREARAQLVAQELMPTVSADANEDPNEITPARLLAMGSCFYWVDPQGNQLFPTNHPFLLAEQFGPRRAATNRSTAPIRNTLQAARSRSQGSAANVTFRLGHPSGLPAQTVELKVERRANAQSVSVRCTYAPRFPTTTTVLGQVPTTLPRLPSWAEIERAYNLTPNVRVVNDVDHNVEERDALARFQVAWLAGPMHVARSLGLADDVTLARIETDYRILLNAVNVPDLFGRRGHRIVMTPDNPGWKLALDPIEALKRQGYPRVSRQYRDQDRMRADAAVLRQMLSDSEWDIRPERIVWGVWSELIACRSLAVEWLDGRFAGGTVTEELRPTIVSRVSIKPCKVPGVRCYRELVGQLCEAGRLVFAVRSLEEVFGLTFSPRLGGVTDPHPRPTRKQCREMVTGVLCVDHWVASVAAYTARPAPEVYRPDNSDARFPDPGRLREALVRQVDTVLSALGNEASGAVAAIFLPCSDVGLADRCGEVLGLVPSWTRISALPRGQQLLSPEVERVLDRTDLLSTARPSLDRIMSFEILAGGIVAAHTPSNVRLIDSARNWARGQRHTAKQADLLEAAVVINNAVRAALGDALADARLEELRVVLIGCAPDASFAMSSGADNFDWATRHQGEIIRARASQDYQLDNYPESSMSLVDGAVAQSCRTLLQALRTELGEEGAGRAAEAEDAAVGEGGEQAAVGGRGRGRGRGRGQGRAARGGRVAQRVLGDQGEQVGESDEEVDEDDVDQRRRGDRNGDYFRLCEYSDEQIAGIRAVVREWQTAWSSELVWQEPHQLPRLPFVPHDWDDQKVLSFAQHANDIADNCDEVGKCPWPPKHLQNEDGRGVRGHINDVTRRNRSAGTLFLAWVRLELQGKLSACRLTGLPLTWPKANATVYDPLRVSRAAHLVHRFPINYGFTAPWPSSSRQFDVRKFNVSVESWFCNKWIRTWRLPALGSMLARRTDWYLQHAASLGLTPLTEAEGIRVREHLGERVTFRNQDSFMLNDLSEGEQVVWARRCAYNG